MITRHDSSIIHAFDLKKSMYERVYSATAPKLAQNPEMMGTQTTEALKLFAFAACNNAPATESIKYLRRGRDYGIGNFIYGSNPGVEFEFAIEDSLHTIVGANVTAYMHTNLWFKTFFSCLITRASKARAELCKTPTSVFQNANIKPNAYDLAYVDLLKGLFDSEANLSQIFKNISDTSDPEVLEVERQDFIYDIMNPTMLLLYHMLRNDENAFNEQLENALNSHKEFWSNNADDSYGWISLPILAACSLAIDNKDFSITVESEYIPKWLYEKDF